MKKIIVFIVFVSIFCSCSKKKNLDGIWMGAYQLHHRDQGDAYSPLKLLFEFDGDSLHSKIFGTLNGDDAYETSTAFRIENDYLLPSNSASELDSLKIISITEDSLVLRLFNAYNRDFVFKKLPATSQTNTIALQGKTYAFETGELKDTIEFINDSSFLYLSNVRCIPVRDWSSHSYKHLNFIMMDKLKEFPLLIDAIQNDTVKLSYFYKKTGDVTLKTLPKKWNLSLLKGSWVSWNAVPKGMDLPQWVEKDSDRGEYLHFSDNQILEKTLFGKEEQITWEATGNHQGIYFPSLLTNGGIGAYWKIIKLSSDDLVIERNDLLYPENAAKMHLEYQRTKY